jgi:hypothetical protein
MKCGKRRFAALEQERTLLLKFRRGGRMGSLSQHDAEEQDRAPPRCSSAPQCCLHDVALDLRMKNP